MVFVKAMLFSALLCTLDYVRWYCPYTTSSYSFNLSLVFADADNQYEASTL